MIRYVVSGVAGGLVVAAVGLVLGRRSPIPAVSHADAQASAGTVIETDRGATTGFAARLSELERQLAAAMAPSVDRVAADATSTQSDLGARIRALEARVAGLEPGASLAALEFPEGGDPERAAEALDRALGATYAGQFLEARARIPLRLQFLEAWPRHPRAEVVFDGLVEDANRGLQASLAREAIDRLGPRTSLPPHTLDGYRLRLAETDAERIAIARRVLASANEVDRDLAWKQLVRSLARLERIDEALAAIEDFARDCDDLSSVRAKRFLSLRDELMELR